ncbi:Mediator complex subunit 15 KIX domain [Arabidopsis thaliana x Arabidopsis arenosa]|uniref:Mediator complex subunit 15 KIX domain n=1 Tax=Arabidopsis thaliana x Arabidopsis arenosa TaxID=1240361 RepID=A0A8T2BXY3_9BRAS|nr:Mediator complex subunit 15 KIX domain [Arabidopsis thaliana x Arabidopsis arenosa]
MKMLTLETKSQNATGSSSSIPAVDTAAWRTHMPPGSRKKIVNKILEILKKQPPFSGSDQGINELRRIAARFEDNIFRGAVNQTEYLRKISAKIVTMKNDSKNAAVSSSSFLYPNYGTSMDSVLYGIRYLFLDAEDMENGNSEPCLVKEEPAVNTSDWRTELPPNSRQRNAYKIMETLEIHVPNLGLQGINELMRIAVSFEDLIFQTAINQVDYFRKISFKIKMLSC